MADKAVHVTLGVTPIPACGSHRRWPSCDITTTRGRARVTCKTCLRILRKADVIGRPAAGHKAPDYAIGPEWEPLYTPKKGALSLLSQADLRGLSMDMEEIEGGCPICIGGDGEPCPHHFL